MQSTNGSAQSDVNGRWHEQVESFKSGMHKLVDRVSTKYNGEPSWLKKTVDRTGEAIKAHPIAAIGIAIGSGYLLVRFLRRR